MQIPTPNDKQFELPPAGTHLATAYRVIDLGTQTTRFNGDEKQTHQIMVTWELPEETMEDGRPFSVTRRYTWSMSEKASLRHDLESWRGVPFTEKDFGEGGFNIKNILGKSCLINIVRTDKDGKSYANVKSISKLMKGQKGPEQTSNEQVYLWINPKLWDAQAFAKLSEYMKGTIMKSPEYAAMFNGHDTEMPDNEMAPDDFGVDIPF
jgi:hypothetical protein